MYAVLYLLVRWGNKRERIRQQQQGQVTDPVLLVRVLASVRLQASWFIKMLLWVTLLLLLFLASLLGLMTIATLVSQDHKPGYTTSEWVEIGLIIVGFPSVVWGLWVCRVSYREILPEKLIRVTNRGRNLHCTTGRLTLVYFTLLGDENGLFELTDTTGWYTGLTACRTVPVRRFSSGVSGGLWVLG